MGLATTSKRNGIVGVRAFHNNPYDGHTLDETLKNVESLTGIQVENTYVDLGYRGHNYEGEGQVHIVDSRKMKKLTRSVRNWFKRRSAIEPVIGHLKSDNGMKRNYLKGVEGDRKNAILSGCGYNLRKLLAAVGRIIFVFRYLGLFFRYLFFRNLISPANFLPVEAI